MIGLTFCGKALVELKAKAPEQGRAQVDVESLEKWIAALPATDDGRAFDEWKTLAPLQHATRLESFKSTLEAGQDCAQDPARDERRRFCSPARVSRQPHHERNDGPSATAQRRHADIRRWRPASSASRRPRGI